MNSRAFDGLDNIKVGDYETPSQTYCGRFNFKGSDQQKKIGELSGGERNRVHLAKTLKGGGNVLLLDEPTNDLDVETLRALEEALLTFPGCAVVISHDRWFLDRIATHILAFEGDSEVQWLAGNYADYEADRKRRLGDAAVRPHRLRYKPVRRFLTAHKKGRLSRPFLLFYLWILSKLTFIANVTLNTCAYSVKQHTFEK